MFSRVQAASSVPPPSALVAASLLPSGLERPPRSRPLLFCPSAALSAHGARARRSPWSAPGGLPLSRAPAFQPSRSPKPGERFEVVGSGEHVETPNPLDHESLLDE